MLTDRVSALPRAPSGQTGARAAPLWDVVVAPPALRHDAIGRRELVARLAETSDTALALVVAPPGYGKTMFLAEWAEHDERPFVWLALAERELNIPKLAARREWRRLPHLVRAVRERYPRFVIVVDDAHWIERASLSTVVQRALNELPSGSTIALAARTEPPLPTARLRALHVLSEISGQQLAMTPTEATALFGSEGVALEVEELETLVQRTEGWPAALSLFAQSWTQGTDPETSLTSRDRIVFDYIREEVLDALPPELLHFAVRTSILEELSGPACDAILEHDGSDRQLEALTGITSLLAPIDAPRGMFRWHPLVRDALRGSLSREAEDMSALHLRASTWYEDAGDQEQAITHAAAAADADRVGQLLTGHLADYLLCGRSGLVRDWLDAFRPEVVQLHPRLATAAALTALIDADLGGAERWSSAIPLGAEAGAGARNAELSVLQAMTTRQGLVDARPELHSRDSRWGSMWLFLRAVSLHLSGERGHADELLDEVVRLSSEGAPVVAVLALAQRAMLAIESKEWETASESTDRAMLLVEEWQLAREPLTAITFAAAAASRAHQGRVDEAKQNLRQGVDLLTSVRDFVPWYGAEARMLLAHASLSLAEIVGARTLLAEASRFARRTPDAVIFAHWFNEAWAYMDDIAESKLAGPSSLTIAELRILRFLPSHRSFREIAAQLGVSANTVKTQAHAVYRKLGAASRSEAVQRALDVGLLGQ